MSREIVADGAAAIRHFADLCYIGQGYHLEIAVRDDDLEPLAALHRDFLAAHDRVYGHATEAPARIVNLRAVHRVRQPAAPLSPPAARAPGRPRSFRNVLIDPAVGVERAAIHRRPELAPGQCFAGPAVIEQPDTTTLLPNGWQCRVEPSGILLIEPVAP
jgi:N-methylhydantoinase A/oxoprolinase/acetone carboxylase beta subunit